MKPFWPFLLLPLVVSSSAIFDNVDTSLPATSIGLYLKSLVRRELGIDFLQEPLEAQDTFDHDEDKLAKAATRLNVKIYKVRQYLQNVTKEISDRLDQPVKDDSKLYPCCSSPLQDRVCTVIHLGKMTL